MSPSKEVRLGAMTQEEFEAAALQALTAGDHPIFAALREQLAQASVCQNSRRIRLRRELARASEHSERRLLKRRQSWTRMTSRRSLRSATPTFALNAGRMHSPRMRQHSLENQNRHGRFRPSPTVASVRAVNACG